MSKLPYAESYRDLIVYQKAKESAHDIFQVTKSFPKDVMYSLTDQIRRSSRSIGAQIAEAWAKRDYEKHFQSKLTDADAERQETQLGSTSHSIVGTYLKLRRQSSRKILRK